MAADVNDTYTLLDAIEDLGTESGWIQGFLSISCHRRVELCSNGHKNQEKYTRAEIGLDKSLFPGINIPEMFAEAMSTREENMANRVGSVIALLATSG
jgi:hypothetical protein